MNVINLSKREKILLSKAKVKFLTTFPEARATDGKVITEALRDYLG